MNDDKGIGIETDADGNIGIRLVSPLGLLVFGQLVIWGITLIVAIIFVITAASAQESFHYKKAFDPEAGLPLYKMTKMPPSDPIGAVPPGWTLSAGQPLIAPPTLPVQPVVMYGGMGGSINEHILRFMGLGRRGATVEMRGGCWSACTLLTSYVSKERLCFAPGSFLAFHAAVETLGIPLRSERATRAMFDSYPPEIKYWINAHGGVANMEVGNYWTMRDHELWTIGYPRCKP